MTQRFLQPSSDGLRKPTDPNKDNGPIINPPRYAQLGGLTGPTKVADRNPLHISKPHGGRGG